MSTHEYEALTNTMDSTEHSLEYYKMMYEKLIAENTELLRKIGIHYRRAERYRHILELTKDKDSRMLATRYRKAMYRAIRNWAESVALDYNGGTFPSYPYADDNVARWMSVSWRCQKESERCD